MAGRKPSSIVFAVGGRITRADIPLLCETLRRQLDGADVALVICEVGAIVDPDAAVVDALARLRLTALRLGCGIRVRHASSELRELTAFMGLRAPMSSGSTRGRTT